MPKPINLEGQKLGRWTVLKMVDGSYPIRFLCRCECGKQKEVVSQQLRNGGSTSCGCRRSEVTTKRNTTHGQACRNKQTPNYITWAHFMARCLDPKHPRFKDYGERGITVCEEWKVFENFDREMGIRPNESDTLERIDNSKGYCKSNCKWASKKEQALNRRSTRWITYDGITLCVADWAKRLGISRSTLRQRLDYMGWSVEKALTTPHKKSPPETPEGFDKIT